MELVVDANVLLASLFKRAVTREILLDSRLKLYAPEYLVIEVHRLVKRDASIRRRIGLPQEALEEALYTLTQKIETYPRKMYTQLLKEACAIAPHHQDAPYLALSLTLHVPLWSNDRGMRSQNRVKVYTTSDIIRALTIS